jgi:hypothetical protein
LPSSIDGERDGRYRRGVRMRFTVAGIVFLGAAVPLACEEFEPTDTTSGDAGLDAGLDATQTPTADSGSELDATPVADAAPDAPASARTVLCGPETCKLPSEVCCIYYGGTGNTPSRFCAVGSCPLQPPPSDAGAGYTNRTAVSCDDPTDCETPGNVCCAVSTSACSNAALLVVECRAPGNCETCATDAAAGLGYQFCRANVTTDCPADAGCTSSLVADRFGDYRYCK